MADSTLAAIRTKVRRLTRSPATSQLTEANLDEYVNTFIQYDFPEHLRLFTLKEDLEWFCQPNIDKYETNSVAQAPQLVNFNQSYISVHGPIYIGGYEASFTQDPKEFYRINPLINSSETIATGDGATAAYNGTLTNIPVLRDQVTFSALDVNDESMVIIDLPDVTNTVSGDLINNDTGTDVGDINYVTGVYNFTFPANVKSGVSVTQQTRPYTAARPYSILYYQNQFVLRPVPDKTYRIQLQVYRRPSEVLQAGASPQLEQWWQYIAYGAAKKIFEDRTDMQSVQEIMPEFKQQERLVLRRTLVQNANERVATIYTNNNNDLYYNYWGSD